MSPKKSKPLPFYVEYKGSKENFRHEVERLIHLDRCFGFKHVLRYDSIHLKISAKKDVHSVLTRYQERRQVRAELLAGEHGKKLFDLERKIETADETLKEALIQSREKKNILPLLKWGNEILAARKEGKEYLNAVTSNLGKDVFWFEPDMLALKNIFFAAGYQLPEQNVIRGKNQDSSPVSIQKQMEQQLVMDLIHRLGKNGDPYSEQPTMEDYMNILAAPTQIVSSAETDIARSTHAAQINNPHTK